MSTSSPQSISFNGLYAKSASETENQSAEYQTQFPELLKDAELSLLRALDILNLNVYADINFNSTSTIVTNPDGSTRVMTTGETAYLAVPNDCEVVRYLTIFLPTGTTPSQDNVTDQNSGTLVNLIRVDESFLQVFWPNKSITKPPIYYAVLGTSKNQFAPPGQLLVAPTPDKNYAVRMAYKTRPGSLSSLDPNTGQTYLSTWYPDLLFYAVMIRSGAFMKSASQVGIWEMLYKDALLNAKQLEARKKGQAYADTSQTTAPLQVRNQ